MGRFVGTPQAEIHGANINQGLASGNGMAHDVKNGFRLRQWQVFPLRNLLVGPAGERHVEPKVMQVLERLADADGEVVERERLLEELWGGRAQTDEPLTRCIASLRRALDDSATDPDFVQTIPKRGYRLVCAVEALEADPVSRPAHGRARHIAMTIAVVVGLGLALFVWNDVADDGETTLAITPASDVARPGDSIAVLPFDNLSPEADNVYLSDGLAAELTNLLSSIPGLKVAAQTSAFALRDEALDIPEIARRLNVDYVLSGNVRQSGDLLRITVQLTEADSGYHAWSQSWERAVADLFAIQDEVAGAVVESLKPALVGDVRLAERTSGEAYELYLRAWQLYRDSREPNIGEDAPQDAEAMLLVTRALALDPDFASAWALLAALQFRKAQWMRAKQGPTFELAESSAQRALSLDPEQALALALLGRVSDYWNWDSEAAAGWFRRAREAAPAGSEGLNGIAILLERHDYDEAAARYGDIAVERDALNIGLKINKSLRERHLGNAAGSWQQLESVRDEAAGTIRFRVFQALFYYLDGNYEQAREFAESLNPIIEACALHRLGRTDEANAILMEQMRGLERGDIGVAELHACFGDHDAAFEWLQHSYDDHDPRLRWMRKNFFLEPLRGDPRWQDLLEKAGLTDADGEVMYDILKDAKL